MSTDVASDLMRIVKGALSEEEQLLRALLGRCSPLYDKQPHGVAMLKEPHLAYLVLRRLVAERYPLKVDWEVSYQRERAPQADLVIGEEDRGETLVEFKIVRTDRDLGVLADVERLSRTAGYRLRLYVLLCWVEGVGKWLSRSERRLELRQEESIASDCYDGGRHSERTLDLLLYEVRT